jgi:hypothetical protein
MAHADVAWCPRFGRYVGKSRRDADVGLRLTQGGHDRSGHSGEIGKPLRCKRETAACAAEHELLRNFLFSEIDEILSAAVHRHNKSQIELFEFGHHLCQIITWRRSKMEAANEGTDLFNAGDFPRTVERVDNAAVAT